MSEEQTPLTLNTYRLNFVRKVQPGDYESKSASASVEFQAGTHMSQEELDRLIAYHYKNLQCHVLDQLGIPYTIDDHGYVNEEAPITNVVQAFPGAAPVASVPQSPQHPATPAAPGTPGNCPKCGGVEWWDNRAENQENRAHGYSLGPDWKCKNRGCNGGKPFAIWPDDYTEHKHLPRRSR